MKVSRVLCQILFLFGLILNSLELISAVNYCDRKLCPSDAKHIACKNKGEFSRRCEIDAQLMSISDLLKSVILDKHNTLRNMVAKGVFSHFKPAARMATMKWNAELDQIASYSVRQCIKKKKKDDCLNTAQFKNVGQNYGNIVWPTVNFTITARKIATEQISMWFDGSEDTTDEEIVSFSNPKSDEIKFFTQMIQEQATDIGCAILRQTHYMDTEQLMICNYSYKNVRGKPVYTTSSEAGSKCETGTHPTYKFLCSEEEEYDLN